jgi:hypothetical protein
VFDAKSEIFQREYVEDALEEEICLSTLYLNWGHEQIKVMKYGFQIQAENKGFWLIELFGKRK